MQLNSLSYTIVVSEKGGAERREIFNVSELSVGRVQGNDLLLPKGNVSKQHAKLFYRDGRFIVTDLNSTNGTYVNRRRIQQATVIAEGDRIYIGDFVLRVEATHEESATWGRTGEQASLSGHDPNDGVQAIEFRGPRHETAGEPTTGATDTAKQEPAPRLGTAPSWADQSTGKLSLSAALANAGEHANSVSGHTVRTESPFSPSAANSASAGELDAQGLLGSLVEAVLLAGRDIDFARIDYAEQREVVERLLDEYLSKFISDGHLPAGTQADRMRLMARNELLDLGPLTRLLEDVSISEVIVPRYDQVLTRKGGQLEIADQGFASPHSLEVIIHRLCQHSDSPVRNNEFHIERRLTGGAYLCAVLPPIATDGPSLVLRRPRTAITSMQSLVRLGTISRAIASFFQQAMAARLRLLIVGPRDAELGVIVGALVSVVGEGPLLVIEGGEDLGLSGASVSFIRWSLLGAQNPAAVVRAANRIVTSHIVMSLEHSEMAAPTIDLIGTGGTGAIVACPGRTIEATLARLSLDVCADKPGLSIDYARRQVASAFDLILEVVRYRDGQQRVVRLAEVGRVTDDEIEVDDVFTFVTTPGGTSDVIEGTFKGLGNVPRIVEEMVARGMPFDTSLFGRAPSR